MAGWNVVAGNVKEVGDRILDGNETLKLSRGLEALHDSLPSSDGLMRILRPVVQALVRPMLDAGHDFPLRRTVDRSLSVIITRAELPCAFKSFRIKLLCSLGIAAVPDGWTAACDVAASGKDETALLQVGYCDPLKPHVLRSFRRDPGCPRNPLDGRCKDVREILECREGGKIDPVFSITGGRRNRHLHRRRRNRRAASLIELVL